MKIGQTQQQNTTFAGHTVVMFKKGGRKNLCDLARKFAIKQNKIAEGNARVALLLENGKDVLIIDDKMTDDLTMEFNHTYTQTRRWLQLNQGKTEEAKGRRRQATDKLGNVISRILASISDDFKIKHSLKTPETTKAKTKIKKKK